MTPPRLVYLIDGSSQMYRAFHAPVRTGEGTLLKSAAGVPTNAVYIFVSMLRKLLQEQGPSHIAAAFDLPGPTFRDELADDYKANRAPMPDDLAAQIPLVHRACEALGVPVLTQARFEADDIIGTLARRAEAEGFDVVIVTSDKDFFQLVDDRIRVFNPRDAGVWYDAAGVVEKFGVPPSQVVDVLALMGDAVDNVKGVPGIGEKGARELVSRWGSLDALLEHAADVPQKKYRDALLTHRAAAEHSREMVTIRTDAPVETSLDALAFRGPDREACFALFSELGFRGLTMEFAPTAEAIATDYGVLTTADALQAWVDRARTAGACSLHVFADEDRRLVGIALAVAPRVARYVPLRHRGIHAGEQLTAASALPALAPLLASTAVTKSGYDLKAAVRLLAEAGVTLQGLDIDALLASYLRDAGRSSYPLESIALEHLGYRAMTEEALLGRGAKAIDFAALPPDNVCVFACERADVALQVSAPLQAALDEAGLATVYRSLEQPLIPVLAEMEARGVKIDSAALGQLSHRLEGELTAATDRIYALAGEPFNIASPQQLSTILFDRLHLPALKRNPKTKTASTAVDVLEELALVHELPQRILEWRALQKLKNTYIDALPQLVRPATGRVHTTFNQAVAATGRLSSSDPNLQNIPVRTALGREIRRAFIAEAGCVLVSADYSQIELRVLAHLAGDETLVRAFHDGVDIHDQTALKVFGTSSGLDPHELRRRAKIINYALLYGKTAFTLSKDIGVSPAAAQSFIDAYFDGFPGVRTFIDRTLADARASGVVSTLWGRQRLVPDLVSPNGQIRTAAERVAVNLPIQGTAADIMKRAMIDAHARLPEIPGAHLILTVHDELVVEVPEGRASEAAALVRSVMEGAASLRVPLTVDVGIGPTWDDAKP